MFWVILTMRGKWGTPGPHSSTKATNELAKPIRIKVYKTLESSQKWTTREKLGEERRCRFVEGECCGIFNPLPTIPQYPDQRKAGDSSQHTWCRLLCHHSHHPLLPLRGGDYYTGCTGEGLESVYTSSNSTHHRKRLRKGDVCELHCHLLCICIMDFFFTMNTCQF